MLLCFSSSDSVSVSNVEAASSYVVLDSEPEELLVAEPQLQNEVTAAEHGDGIVVESPAGDETMAIDENQSENVAESNQLPEVEAEVEAEAEAEAEEEEDPQLAVVSEEVSVGTNEEDILNGNIHKCSDKIVILNARVDGETNESITIHNDNLNSETNAALSDHISSDTSANGVGDETTLPVESDLNNDESISCDGATPAEGEDHGESWQAEEATETLHQTECDDDNETAVDLSTSRTADNEGK